MVDYEINDKTFAILPLNKRSCKIIENNKTYVVNKSVKKIMEDSCEYFGSSLEGRQRGTTKLTGITHKVPIIVEESKEIIFFPTSSPRLEDCSWISLNNILRYFQEENYLIVEFKNKIRIKLDISYGIFDNQVLRSTRLESAIRNRKKLLLKS